MWQSILQIILTHSRSWLLSLLVLLPSLSSAAITLEVDGSTASPVTVYKGVSAKLEAEIDSCPSGDYFYEVWFYSSGGGGSCSGKGKTSIIAETDPPATSCNTGSSVDYTFSSNGQKTLCYGYKACDKESGCIQPNLNKLDETGSINVFVRNAPAGIAYFTVTHDGYGINCVGEIITVTAYNNGGAILTNFTGQITLDTQTSTGTWTLNSGNGTFSDATANDGLAVYTFDAADNGVASFNLNYQEGVVSFDIDAYLTSNSSIRDDDSEGNITFSPSGFTVTANPLSNPPPAPINDPILAHTAGTTFPLHITAYGQTPTDPTCGVIEAYDGNKNLKFWSGYNNPTAANAAGTQVSVGGSTIVKLEADSVSQVVTFTNGQALINAKYKDVGDISINMKDDTVADPSLANGIRGATNNFVVKPAEFILSSIVRTSDNLANPAALDAVGAAFMHAADVFSVTVTAKDSEGDTTLSYGKEDTPETVALTTNLIGPAGGNNPAIVFTNGFAAFTDGVSSGTDFSWAEVGIIALIPSIGDADYLGAGDVTGTNSENVGRFYPDHFDTTVIQACNTFTYSGQPFSVWATAKNSSATPATTENYTGSFAYDATLSDAGDTANFTLNIIPAANFNNGTANKADVVYTFATKETAPLTITLRANDTDTGTTSGVTEGTTEIRSGRSRVENTYGSELIDMTVTAQTEYYTSNGFVINTADTCSAVDVSLVDTGTDTVTLGTAAGQTCIWDDAGASVDVTDYTCIDDATKPQFNEPAVSGSFGITFKAPGTGGTGDINVTLISPAWLKYDWDGDGANDDDPTGTASFGLYRGDDRIIYWREVF